MILYGRLLLRVAWREYKTDKITYGILRGWINPWTNLGIIMNKSNAPLCRVSSPLNVLNYYLIVCFCRYTGEGRSSRSTRGLWIRWLFYVEKVMWWVKLFMLIFGRICQFWMKLCLSVCWMGSVLEHWLDFRL